MDLKTTLDVAQRAGIAHNNGAGGLYLLCATEAQLLAFVATISCPVVEQTIPAAQAVASDAELTWHWYDDEHGEWELSRPPLQNSRGLPEGFRLQLYEHPVAAAQAGQAQGEEEPVTVPADYLQGHADGLEWAALMVESEDPRTGDWLYDDRNDLAEAIRRGPDMPPSAPAVDRGLSEAQTLRVKSMIVGMTLNVSTETRAKFADELLDLLGLPR